MPYINFPVITSPSPPSPLIIESFDSLSIYSPDGGPVAPNFDASIGDLYWENFGGFAQLSTSHVTQGTHSWLLSVPTVSGGNDFLDIRTSFYTLDGNNIVDLDLSGYNTLTVDVYVSDIGGDMWVYFSAGEFGFSYEDGIFITTTSLGAQTLTIDLTSATWDLTSTSIRLGIQYNDSGSTFHAVDAYFDNLRATT